MQSKAWFKLFFLSCKRCETILGRKKDATNCSFFFLFKQNMAEVKALVGVQCVSMRQAHAASYLRAAKL